MGKKLRYFYLCFKKYFKKIYKISYVNTSLMEGYKKGTMNALNFEDLIFILLNANNSKSIHGKIVFVKQMFLLSKEIFPEFFSEMNFYPSDYGPFSKKLMKKIDELIDQGFIKKVKYSNPYGSKTTRYILTKKGIDKANNLYGIISNKKKDKIITSRDMWESLGYKGVLRFVYSKYPEYTIKSKILDEL